MIDATQPDVRVPNDPCNNLQGPGICIPIYWEKPKDPRKQYVMEKSIRTLTPHEHSQLRLLDQSGHNLNHLLRVMHIVDRYNTKAARQAGQKHQNISYQTMADTSSAAGFIDTADATRERIMHLADDFTRKMNVLNEKQLLFYNAVGKEAKVAARAAYQRAYHEAMHVLNHNAKFDFLGEDTRHYLRTANHALKMGVRKGVWVNDLRDVQILRRVGKYGKWMGWGIYGLTVAKDFRDVMITRKDGGDWKKEAAEDAGGILTSAGFVDAVDFMLPRVLCLFVPGVGWVVFTLWVAADLVALKYGNHFGSFLGGEIERWVKEI